MRLLTLIEEAIIATYAGCALVVFVGAIWVALAYIGS